MNTSQRVQLVLKTSIPSFCLSHSTSELDTPDDWYKLSRFQHLPLSLKETNHAFLFHSQTHMHVYAVCLYVVYVCICTCIGVSTKETNVKHSLGHWYSAVMSPTRQGGRGQRGLAHRSQGRLLAPSHSRWCGDWEIANPRSSEQSWPSESDSCHHCWWNSTINLDQRTHKEFSMVFKLAVAQPSKNSNVPFNW